MIKPIDEMSDQEKSVVLATLCGWRLVSRSKNRLFHFYLFLSLDEADYYTGAVHKNAFKYTLNDLLPNLYDPANMELAWKALNWGLRTHINSKDFNQLINLRNELRNWLSTSSLWGTNFAQRLWLDKILSLAIEAGLID